MKLSAPRRLDTYNDPARLKPHPFADLVPTISGEMAMELHRDIALHGLIDPIVLFQGAILDGRSRYDAALGNVNIDVVDLEGTEDEAFAYVVSKNLPRRHLNASQRAIFAARAIEMLENNPHLGKEDKRKQAAILLQDFIVRPHIDPLQIWPPPEGFEPSSPATLRGYAQSKGIKNKALVPIGDEREEDQAGAAALMDGVIRENPDVAEMIQDRPATDSAIVWPAMDLAGSTGYAESAPAAVPPPPAAPLPPSKRGRGRPALPPDERRKPMKTTMIQTRAARRRGIPEIGAAIASGHISSRRGAELAALPKDQQLAALTETLQPKPKGPPRKYRPRGQPAPGRVDDLVSLLCDDALVADLPAFAERNGTDAAKALMRALTVFCGEVVKLIPLPEEQEHAAA